MAGTLGDRGHDTNTPHTTPTLTLHTYTEHRTTSHKIRYSVFKIHAQQIKLIQLILNESNIQTYHKIIIN